MKFVHIAYHFEFTELVEKILDGCEITEYVRYPLVDGCDVDGKHFGTQVFPGNNAVIQALMAEEKVTGLLEALGRFREEKKAHEHLRAAVIGIERKI